MAKKKLKMDSKQKKIVFFGIAALLAIAVVVGLSTFASGPTTHTNRFYFSGKDTGWGRVDRVGKYADQLKCKASTSFGRKWEIGSGKCVDRTTHDETQTITYKATPEKCSVFTGWEFGNGDKSNANPISVSRKVSHKLTAHFRAVISDSCDPPMPPTFF